MIEVVDRNCKASRGEMRIIVLTTWLSVLVPVAACADDPRDSRATPSRAPAAHRSDWPGFLGPTADSQSTERGILTRWPADGPPRVWQLPLGMGYCMPAIADGRLFQFDRVDDSERLRCLDARSAELLWTFEYPSTFSDLYGYDNGPRSSPVVDDGRVYIFGPHLRLTRAQVFGGLGAFSVLAVFFLLLKKSVSFLKEML